MKQHRKYRVGLDFDDVLIDFNTGLALFHNEQYGTSYKREHVTRWDFGNLWGCTTSEALRRMKEFVRSDHHVRISPIAGAVEAVSHLREICDLYIITARDDVLSHQTFTLMNEHFPESFKSVHFLHRGDVNVLGTKGEVCTSLGINIFVEDSLLNASHTGEAGIRTLLFDTPWNQTGTLPSNVTRVFSWEEILRKINR